MTWGAYRETCVFSFGLCVISYLAKHAFLPSLSGDWLTGEEGRGLHGDTQEPQLGTFQKAKDLNARA